MANHRLTLANDSITFTPRGIWIQPTLSDGFWFSGSVVEFLSIVVYHHELDIEHATIRVRE